MRDDMRIAQTLGLLDGTLGSVRDYTAEDYKRRLEMAACLLRGEKYSPELITKDMQRQAILDNDTDTARVIKVREFFDSLYKMYRFSGESGTEQFAIALGKAATETLSEASLSHEEDFCFMDCVSALARNLDDAVEARAATV